MLRVRACGLSDVGVIRSHNEDCFEIDPEHQVFVVADGMGGHSHGEIASRIAVEAIREFVSKTADEDATLPFDIDPRLGAPLEPPEGRDPHRPRPGAARRSARTPRCTAWAPRSSACCSTREHGRRRPRRRQPRLPPARRQARAADAGPHLGQRAGGGRLPLRGAGARPPAQERRHPRPGRRHRGGRRRARVAARAGRPLPALLGRADHDALRRRRSSSALKGNGRLEETLPPAGARRQLPRRLRQHLASCWSGSKTAATSPTTTTTRTKPRPCAAIR